MALFLGLLRRTHLLSRHTLSASGWLGSVQPLCRGMRRCRGLVLGIIGRSASARSLATRSLAFKMSVLYFDVQEVKGKSSRTSSTFPPAARRMDTLNDLLAASDLVSLHCALTNETVQIINADCLQHIKPGAFLVNTASSQLLDDCAVKQLLIDGTLAGCALDGAEGPQWMEAWVREMPNVLILPHSADYSEEVWMEIREKAISILQTFFLDDVIPENAGSDEDEEESETVYENEHFDRQEDDNALQVSVTEKLTDDIHVATESSHSQKKIINQSKESPSHLQGSGLSQNTPTRSEVKRTRSGKKAKKRHGRQKSLQKTDDTSILEKESTSHREDDTAMSGTDQVLSSSSRFASPEDSRSRKTSMESVQKLSSEHLPKSSPHLNRKSADLLKDGYVIALHARDRPALHVSRQRVQGGGWFLDTLTNVTKRDPAAQFLVVLRSKDTIGLRSFTAGAVNASAPVAHVSEKAASPKITSVKDEAVSNHLLMSKDKAPAVRRNSLINGLKAGSTSSTRKEGKSFGSLSAATNKLQASSVPTVSKIEPLFVEPPSEMKKLVSKIVEFIIKNGKQFEAVLIEQDSEHGRFPFLLPSNQYNPYYLKVLQEAQKSKVSGKSSVNEKDGLLSLESAGCNIPYDSDRKEKFKMVIGKSKNDGQDPPPNASQQQFGVSVDAAAAAAILQAATRGIRKPNLGFLSRSSLNGTSRDHSSEGGQFSSLGSFPSSLPQSVDWKSDQNGVCSSVPVAKEIAKAAAFEAASEAESCEAHLTREQKLKAERLRRAKMFVAMIKSGSAQLKPEVSRGLSVEPQGSNVFDGAAVDNIAAKERVGISAPLEIDTSEKIESSGKKHSADEYNERMSRRKYRSRSIKREEAEDDVNEDEVVHKHSRKKHHSHRSSLEDDKKEEKDEEERVTKHSRKKHRLRRTSHGDEIEDDERDHKYSRKQHRSHRSSHEDDDGQDEEEHDHKRSRKKHRSHCSSHHSRDGHKHRKRHSSSRDEERRYHHKRDISFEDEEHLDYCIRSYKHGKGSQSDREELEEGEISSEVSDQSRGSVGGGANREAAVDRSVGGGANREASVDLSSSYMEPSEPTEVSDDLRAKIRAMLMGTL